MRLSSSVLLIPVIAAGTFLRCWGLDAQPFWFDETLTWRMMDFTLPEMVEAIRSPEASHPPLYYYLLRAWVFFWGDSEVALRSVSVLFGIATIIATYGFVRAACSLNTNPFDPGRPNRAALIAATLVALSVSQIHASRQARMYSLGTALMTASSWLLLIALRGGTRRRTAWVLYGLLAVALCYTHAIGACVVISHILFTVCYLMFEKGTSQGSASQWSWAVGVGVGIALCLIPVVPMMTGKATGVTWKVDPSLEGIAYETAIACFSTFATPIKINGVVAWCLVLGLFGMILWLMIGADWSGRWFGVTAFTLFALMVGYSFGSGKSIYLARYLTFLHVTWIAAAAYWLSGLSIIRRGLVVSVIAIVWATVSYPVAWQVIGPEAYPGMRGAADYIASHAKPNEAVLTQRSITLLKASYYLRGKDTAKPRLCVLIPSRRLQTQGAWLREEELISIENAICVDTAGVWVLSTSWYNEATDIVFPLPGNWQVTEQIDFPQDYPGEGAVRLWHFHVQLNKKQ